MGKLRWYKRDPVAALEGMSNLTLEEKGAYNTVLDLIYARDGAVDDDPRFIAGWMRCDVRVWKRIRERLIALGKLYVVDGALRNERADVEVDRGLLRVASESEANRIKGIKSGQARRKNKEIVEPVPEPETNITTTTTRKETGSLRSPRSDWPDDAFEIFWKAYPHKVGKRAALRAFAAARRTGVPWARVILALERYTAEKPPDRAWCNPSTWLNQGRWDDQPAAPIQPNGRGRAPPTPQPTFREIAAELRDSIHETPSSTGSVRTVAGAEPSLDFG